MPSQAADGREPSLQSQAITAALVHEQAPTAPTSAQLQQIEDFERQLFMAQHSDNLGALLGEPGGPPMLAADNLASDIAGVGAVPAAGDLLASFDHGASCPRPISPSASALFADLSCAVSTCSPRVSSACQTAPCTTCHRLGINRSFDIGTTNLPTAKESPELPVFRITCDASASPQPQLGRTFLTQDPGRALITGKCVDAGSPPGRGESNFQRLQRR